MTIKSVIDSITQRRFLLPAIQREFVWNEEQTISLFDSLMKDYPIGTFLFWKVQKDRIKNFQFYEFIKDYHERDKKHNPKASVSHEEELVTILDGQQRLTALYIGLKGTYASRIPWRRWESDDAFPKRKLYLNLASPATGEELRYEFSFKSEYEANQKGDKKFWFEIGKVLEFSDLGDVFKFLRSNELLEPDFPQAALTKLLEIIIQKPVINYYLETSQELDKVLNIFIRVNSGGTQLSYSDLLLSIATARWKTKDAREEITRFVDEINQIGDGFKFDKDFVMKCCLVISDISDITFKGDNFNLSNMSKIEEKWEDIKKAIRISVELVSSFGYNFQTLTAATALIPISYYLILKKNPENFALSTRFKGERELIKRWLTLSLLKRAFSGQPDTVLRPIRQIINKKFDSFPIEEIINHFKGTSKSIIFTEDDIESFLFYEYGKAHTFSVLALLYPGLDFRNKFHQDHIFANSFFRRSELKKRNIPDSKVKFYLENNDFIGNIQLLEGLPNTEKLDKEFDVWLEKMYPNKTERNEFKKRHFIPIDIDLSFTNFEEFFTERNKLITRQLSKILL